MIYWEPKQLKLQALWLSLQHAAFTLSTLGCTSALKQAPPQILLTCGGVYYNTQPGMINFNALIHVLLLFQSCPVLKICIRGQDFYFAVLAFIHVISYVALTVCNALFVELNLMA